MRRFVVMGATSGIGREIALELINEGMYVALAGRRAELLQEMAQQWPGQVRYAAIDVNTPEATAQLDALIADLGGMDCYIHVSGAGHYNPELEAPKEMVAAETNVVGFTRMIDAAFNWFVAHSQPGHIAAVSSIAGTKGLGAAPAYSASKRFQNTYLDALDQQARMRRLPIRFTDIRPGFVDTDFLKGAHFPMLLKPDAVARKAVRAILHRRKTCTIDWRYAILVALWRCVPRCVWCRLRVK